MALQNSFGGKVRYSGFPVYRPLVEALEDRNLFSFLPPVSYDIGSSLRHLAAGDFNGDGKLDLVTADILDDAVSVLLNNGDGTFQSGGGYAVGSHPWFVAVGDFRGNGILDIAVALADPDSSHVDVLLGNGDGSFQDAAAYATGPGGGDSLAVGDFNGDGKLDLAVSINTESDNVSVLLGNGDGSFQAPVSYTVGEAPGGVAVGDFNGDGRPDLVLNNHRSHTVSVLLGNGDGSFQDAQHYPVGLFPKSVVVGDLNGDGWPDIVAANSHSDTVSVLLGNGDGSFQDAVNYPVGLLPFNVGLGDFNGDGQLDIVTANAGSDDVSLLLGNGDGTFEIPFMYAVGSEPAAVAVGDFNGDGWTDLAAANYSSNNVTVLLNAGDWLLVPWGPEAIRRGSAAPAGAVPGAGRPEAATVNALCIGDYSVPLGAADRRPTAFGVETLFDKLPEKGDRPDRSGWTEAPDFAGRLLEDPLVARGAGVYLG